jgi:hypothetical protein
MAGGLNLLGNLVPGVSSDTDIASAIAKIGGGTSATGATPAVGSSLFSGFGAGAGSAAPGGFGLNIPTANLALGGVSTLANLFMGMQALGQAKDQFNFTRRTTQANLENQTKSYNTNMEDKLTARAAFNGQGREYVDDYMNKNRLSTPKL